MDSKPDDLPAADAAAEARARLMTKAGQSEVFRDALKWTLDTMNHELQADGIPPSIKGVLAALTMIEAEFIAMLPDAPARRAHMKEAERNLKRLVTLRVTAEAPKLIVPERPN